MEHLKFVLKKQKAGHMPRKNCKNNKKGFSFPSIVVEGNEIYLNYFYCQEITF